MAAPSNRPEEMMESQSRKYSGRSPAPPGDRAVSRDRSSDNSRSNSRPPAQSALQLPANGTAGHRRNHLGGRPSLSASNSVTSSREGSPIRPLLRSLNSLPSSSTSRSASRSRRNSDDFGPPSRPPSDAAVNKSHSETSIEGKLASLNMPNLAPASDRNTSPDSRRPSKPAILTMPENGSRQSCTSPRLKSPPPPQTGSRRNSLSRNISPKPAQQDSTIPANISSKRQPGSTADYGNSNVAKYDGGAEDGRNRTPTRVSTRGATSNGPVLETVQEAGTPMVETPTISLDEEESDAPTPKAAPTQPTTARDSGSDGADDTAGDKPTGKDDSRRQLPASTIVPKRSFTSLPAARGKPGEASMKNMIVETETVSSIPQLSLGGGTADRAASGRKEPVLGVRTKASDETIRPKKEKKKQVRKATTNTGTVSSKADIFEAKVASAVDDADTSDSEETFVYDSNPPDTHPNRQHRYHSRTPSATSMGSQFDQYGGRQRAAMRDVSHGVAGKRSMKFTNTYNTMDEPGDEPSSTRGSSRNARHYHPGRPGRNGTNLDQAPFPPGFKSPRHLISNGGRHNRSASPRIAQGPVFKNGEEAYDYDFDAEGADDERTPLVIGMGRTRVRQGRRPNSASMRQMEYFEQQRRGWFSRYGICAFLLVLIFALIGCATTFVVGVSKAITNLEVHTIQNILASEQEIILDLDVEAINPNLISITISEMDVDIFARSRFVGSDRFWRDHGPHPEVPLPRTADSRLRAIMARNVQRHTPKASGGVDEGTDPPPFEDPEGDPQTMLLGRIFHFDSPLTFEPSPWKHEVSRSVGQIRLAKPGNKTEEGGSLRWERVLQHPFELILRGVVKYELPLTSHPYSAKIGSSVKVFPDDDTPDDDDGHHHDNTTKPDQGSFHTN